MTESEIETEVSARRFLLGEMPADERSAFEERFVADEQLFEQIRVIEDELIESYVRGTLSAAEKEKFERSILTTEPRRNRVAFTRTMLETLLQSEASAAVKKSETAQSRSSVWQSLANLFKTPQLAFGAAFVLLVFIFGGWLLLRPSNKTEIARQAGIHESPTPTVEASPANQNHGLPSNQNEANSNALQNGNDKPPGKNQNANTPKQDSTGLTPVLALFSGAVRSEGKLPELNLPKGADGAQLQLNLSGQSYQTYRAEVVDADGAAVFQSHNLQAKNSQISFFVPAAKLQAGDYLVKLSALNRQNARESVAEFSFRVNRK